MKLPYVYMYVCLYLYEHGNSVEKYILCFSLNYNSGVEINGKGLTFLYAFCIVLFFEIVYITVIYFSLLL